MNTPIGTTRQKDSVHMLRSEKPHSLSHWLLHPSPYLAGNPRLPRLSEIPIYYHQEQTGAITTSFETWPVCDALSRKNRALATRVGNLCSGHQKSHKRKIQSATLKGEVSEREAGGPGEHRLNEKWPETNHVTRDTVRDTADDMSLIPRINTDEQN